MQVSLKAGGAGIAISTPFEDSAPFCLALDSPPLSCVLLGNSLDLRPRFPHPPLACVTSAPPPGSSKPSSTDSFSAKAFPCPLSLHCQVQWSGLCHLHTKLKLR